MSGRGRTGAAAAGTGGGVDSATATSIAQQQAAAAVANRVSVQSLAAVTSGTAGYIGSITPGSFGVNAGGLPAFTGSGPASRLGLPPLVAAATQVGNWLRIFFGFAGNGVGGTGVGSISGLFQAGSLAYSVTNGNGAGYVTSGALAIGATAIPLVTGTGNVNAGDSVTFAGDTTQYPVVTGVSAPGTVLIAAPGLRSAKASGVAVSVVATTRLDDLRYAIQTAHAAGLKLLVTLEDPVPTTDAAMSQYAERLYVLLRIGLQTTADRYLDSCIDAIEPSNEVYQQGVSYERVAELMRVTYTNFKAASPRTIVLSPSYQGGEAIGANSVLQMMAASAAGVQAPGFGVGTTGAGTTGEMFFDAIAFHPYPETVPTVASALAALGSSVAQNRIKEFIDPIRSAIAARRAANTTFWVGKPDPEIWATEYNVNPDGGVATTNSTFRMQAFSVEQRGLLIEQIVHACFAAGVAKVFPYALDHQYSQGPILVSKSAAPSGELRLDTQPGGGTAILDGDLLYVQYDNHWGYAYNCSENGRYADVKGMPSWVNAYQVIAYRWQLGGWHDTYRAIQAKFIGYAETGFFATGVPADPYQPQLRINRGQVLRAVAGKLTDVGV